MQLPAWMKIAEKGTFEILLIWGIPLMIALCIALAIWVAVTDPPSSNPGQFQFPS